MSKKISTIFLSLFLIGILSVSCSNADKTGAGETAKGIEQYNGNTYVSEKKDRGIYLWVSIKDGKVGIMGHDNNTSEPSFLRYMDVTGSGTHYNFNSSTGDTAGTLKFSDTSVTFRFTKNDNTPSIVDQDFVCNKKQ